ncbi:MAG: DUF2029 domain-containing protein [Chloroflexi bacterium]|uniref:DUF2029 domain-containing protein n=1 Tax=Candidatus Chlorohelix allophototropha TaxID=3003348 RepID=A0A8T7M5I9_9CHLR|nr:DUF2029 domain-containing protein [Chloroflexota bacterium]WJW69259.1 DUF2029 domain-containing protein [Chloroflexota bacterium L227-S17]
MLFKQHKALIIPLLLSVIIFIIAWMANIATNTFFIDIGASNRIDKMYMPPDNNGFYIPETRQDAKPNEDNSFRWTSKEAILDLPEILLLTPWKATIKVSAPRPAEQPTTTLIISLADNRSVYELGQFPLPASADGKDITFAIPARYSLPNSSVDLLIESSTSFQPGNGDKRTLGLVLYNLKFEPDYTAYGIKDWGATLLLPLLVSLIALAIERWIRLFGAGLRLSSGIQIVAAIIMISSLISWQELVETAYLPWAITLWVTWLAFRLAQLFTERAPSVPAPFIYAACFMGVLPVVQVVFNRLDLNKWGDTAVVAAQTGALLLALAAYLFARKYFEPLLVWLFVIAAVISFACLNWIAVFDSFYHGFDFRVYYNPQVLMEQNGTPLFDLNDIIASPGSSVRTPPTFALLNWLLLRFYSADVQGALYVWRIVNELLLIPIIFILYKLTGTLKYRLPLVLFLVLNFRQLAFNMDLAQPNIVMLLFLALTAILIKNKRDTLSGAILAFPIWLKLLPGITAFYYLVERRWRGLLGLIAGSVVVNGLVIAAVGWDNVWYYYSKAMWGVNQPEIGLVGQSFWGFLGRMGVDEVQKSFTQDFPTALMPIGYAFSLCALGLTLFALWRNSSHDWQASLLKFNALLVTSMVISPFIWKHYTVMLLGAIVVMALYLSRIRSGWSLIVFSMAYGIMAFDQDFLFFPDRAYGLGRIASSTFFFALFALWALHISIILKYRPDTKTDTAQPAYEANKMVGISK